jgi:ubiquinone/menaquinone biosynthesis C-methylase UbiE
MPATTQSKFSPFDALAPHYDDLFTNSQIGRAQRQVVWTKLQEVFKPGDRILEINCGTGIDAVFLARMGVRVLALDSSAGMVAATQRRIEQEAVGKRVSAGQLAIEELRQLKDRRTFDGVLSNFGGLNCISDLQQFGSDLARIVRPGGRAMLCVMGRWCLWELSYYLGRFQPQKAFRRTRAGGAVAELRAPQLFDFGTEIPSVSPTRRETPQLRVHYPSVSTLSRALAPHFIRRSFRAVGLVVPPSYLEPWVSRHRKFLTRAVQLDGWIGHWPGLRNMGDHYLVEMERT